MKVDDLLDAIGEIDDSFLEPMEEKTKHKKIFWSGIASLAACLALFLFLPNGFLSRWMSRNETDYAPMDCASFLVYYVDGESLLSFNYEIFGGYDEMFFAWKNQNGIGQDVLLKDITIHSVSDGDSEFSLNSDRLSANILRVTLSSSFSSYLEENDTLLLESLKKTVASYLGVRISEIELFLTE